MHLQHTRNFCILLVVCSSFISSLLTAQTRCLTYEVHQKKMATDALYRKNFEQENNRSLLSGINATSMVDTTITIPVVIHVLYNSNEQNVSDEEIQSQIDVLNEDFAANNASSLDVPSDWINLITDSKIRFKLAQRDPAGNNSNGII